MIIDEIEDRVEKLIEDARAAGMVDENLIYILQDAADALIASPSNGEP